MKIIDMKNKMQGRIITASEIISEWKRLMQSGVLGIYDYCEVTEIVGFNTEDAKIPFNVLSLFVFQQGEPSSQGKKSLNEKRIKLPGLKSQYFGIYRYYIKTGFLSTVLDNHFQNNYWNSSGDAIHLGNITPLYPFFVPADTLAEKTPINSVLKNNFWNGSYILELFDNSKKQVISLLENPPLLEDLSFEIQKYVPIRLAELSDRLGNILLQLPITIAVCGFSFGDSGAVSVSLAWHPNATPRNLNIVTQTVHDGLILSYTSRIVETSETEVLLKKMDVGYPLRSLLWDETNNCILAATNPYVPIREIRSRIQSGFPKFREIIIPDENGESKTELVSISNLNSAMESKVGDASIFNYQNHIHNRIYNNERKRLKEARNFLQYGVNQANEKVQALSDLRFLIDNYGEEGAWLWDPYLSYTDIIKTLFLCKHGNSDLRALGDFSQAKNLDEEKSYSSFEEWRKAQCLLFMNNPKSHVELKFEFRSRHGGNGYRFHDRFLIFPFKGKAPFVWSLGTSINGFGTSHHILQRVDNGRLIQDAFQQLWDQLAVKDCLVWKRE